MNGQLVLVLFWIFGFVGFIVLLYIVCSNLSRRPSKMKELAEKYGLSYTRKDRPFKLADLFMPEYKENIIEGKINNKDILIYDRMTNVFDIEIGAKSKSFTVFFINGVEEKQDNYHRRVSLNTIDSFLADLKSTN